MLKLTSSINNVNLSKTTFQQRFILYRSVKWYSITILCIILLSVFFNMLIDFYTPYYKNSVRIVMFITNVYLYTDDAFPQFMKTILNSTIFSFYHFLLD